MLNVTAQAFGMVNNMTIFTFYMLCFLVCAFILLGMRESKMNKFMLVVSFMGCFTFMLLDLFTR